MRSSYRDLPDGVIGLGTLDQGVLGAMDGVGLSKPDVAAAEKPDPADLSGVGLAELNEAELLESGVLFATEWDRSCYRALLSRQRALRAQLDAVERALNIILSRARWPVEAIMDRDG